MTAEPPSNKDISDPEPTKTLDVDEELRLGSWNCANLKGQNLIKALKYCKESGCEIIALQETNHEPNAGTKVEKGDFTIFYIPRLDIEGTNIKKKGRTPLKKKTNVINSPEKTIDAPATESSSAETMKTEKNPDRGLAFMVKNSSMKTKIENVEAMGLDPRIAVLRFKMNGVPVSLLNIYAPVVNVNEKSVEKSRECYDKLSKFYKAEKKDPNRIVIICGDMNAFPVDASRGLYEPWMMSNVYGSSNAHGDVFSDFLRSNGVYHLNSRFEKIKEKKWTHKKQELTEIDGFLSDRIDILIDVDTFSRLDGSNDHRMVISNWKISKTMEDKIRDKQKVTINESDLITIGNGSMRMNDEAYKFYSIDDDHSVDSKAKNDIVKKITNEFVKMYGEQQDVQTSPGPLEESKESLQKNQEVPKLEEKSNKAVLTKQDVSKELEVIQKENPTMISKLTATVTPAELSWGKVVFLLKKPATPMKYLDYFDFIGRITLSAAEHSNILAQKSNEKLSEYIYDGHEFQSSEIRLQEKEIEQEHRLYLTLLLDKFQKKPLYYLFVKFERPFENVKLSSVMKSLRNANVAKEHISAFSSFLLGMKAELIIGKDSRIVEKHHGLHLGDIASRLLMKAVLRMIFKESEECGNPNKIIHENGIVIIDNDINKIQSRLESFAERSRYHGLHVDENYIVLLKKGTGGNEFKFRGRAYRTNETVVNRIITFMDHVICMKNSSRATIARNEMKALEALYKLESIPEKNEEKLEILREEIIPILFNACETWKSLEVKTIVGCLKKFMEHLGIKTFNFNIVKYVIYEKALMLDQIRTRKNNICKDLATTSGKTRNPLFMDVLMGFKNHMKEEFKKNNSLKSMFGKEVNNLKTIALIDFIGNENIQKCWNDFIRNCKDDRFFK